MDQRSQVRVPLPSLPGRGERLPVPADRQRTGPPIESQYSDGAWYRVDPQHQDQDGTPPPHLAKMLRKHPISPAESVSLEIGSWNTSDEWQSSSLVIPRRCRRMPTDSAPVDEVETER